MPQTQQRTMQYLVIIACPFFIASCFLGHSSRSPEQLAEKIASYVAEGGYAPERAHRIKSTPETWRHDGQALEVVLLTPEEQGFYPLVIYLPGLGERADGGQLWRETWAKAGYAVFSVQPIEIGDALKDTLPMPARFGGHDGPPERPKEGGNPFGDDPSGKEQAIRKSELRFLGHQYSSQESLTKRINLLDWAYGQFKQKVKTKQGLFISADLSRLIIAGYDIGAQATAAIIGEELEAGLPQHQALNRLPPLSSALS